MQVMAGAPVGGIETFFFDAVCALSDAGVAEHVVVRPNVPSQLERLKARGVPYTTTGFNAWLSRYSRGVLRRTAAACRPDIIQYWTGRAGMAGFACDAPQVAWYGGYRNRRHFKTCSHFIAITPEIVERMRGQGIVADRIALIPIFAEFSPHKPLDRANFATPSDVPLLLALARLHWKKGLDVLLDALAKVPRAHLWIAGEGEDRAKLQAQVQRLGLDGRVRFLGWRTDREALLATADICVFPSRFEPFGAVMLEAWAAGCPLIAAASQGPGTYVENEKNGLLVPVDDSAALAAAIARAIAEPDLRARVVEGGRGTFERGFTKEVYVRDMLAFYDRVLKDGA
jgi:hypothetical protein